MSSGQSASVLRINPSLLLAIYGVVAVGLGLIVVDKLFLNSTIQTAGPSDPHEYLWFTVLFTLPHILASFFGFFDREYVREYGNRMMRGAQYIALAIIPLMLISTEITFLVFALYTMTHVFLQQSGISKSLMRGANAWHRPWQWTGVLMSFALYITIYADFIDVPRNPLLFGFAVATIPYILLAWRAARASTTVIGTRYFWATAMVPLAGGVFLWTEYLLLIIAIPRIIHDLTAYAFYVSHDHNRWQSAKTNHVYSAAARIGLPVVLVSPLLSILLAYPFQAGGLGSQALPLLMFIALFHYYVEGFIWQRGSLHRRYIHYSQPKIDLL